MAFLGVLTGTVGGTADDRGLYAFDDDMGLISVVREGAPFLGSTISLLDFYANTLPGHQGEHGFNDLGQLAFSYQLTNGQSGIAIATLPTAIPGDANNDGRVNVGDLGILATNFNRSGMTRVQGDFNADGMVSVADLGILATNFNRGTNLAGASFAEALAEYPQLQTAVPEPTTLGVLALGGLGLLGRRPRA